MKRLLIPFLALALCPPAIAVDYVKCEAMNSAAARIKVNAENVRTNARDEHRAMKLEEVCGTRDSSYEWIKCSNDNWRHGWGEGLEVGANAAAVELARLEQIKADYEAAGCP